MRALALLAACVLAWSTLARAAREEQGPCQPTVAGRLETLTLASSVFRNERTLRVWLPPAFDAGLAYPVLYILDGASAFDRCTAFRGEELRADETLGELIGAGKIPPLIAVGVDNGSDVVGNRDDGAGRASEFLAYGDDSFPRPFVPQGAAFPAFLSADVLPAIAARFPVRSGPEHTAIWGASYGGAAALYTIAHRPGLFGAAIIESPSLQVGNGQLLRDTQFLARAPARIALGVGTAEAAAQTVNATVLSANRQLLANLKAALSPTNVTLTVAEGGRHDTPSFGRRLAAALLFIYGGPARAGR